VHRAGETGLLAEYPDTAAVLAAAEAVRALSPAHLLDLVPAERTLLLRGADARDLPDLEALLAQLPPAASEGASEQEVSVGIVYDGEDLDEVAELLDMSTNALISAHSGATWTAAFGGFAPGFAYLLAEDPQESVGAPGENGPVGPPWEVPRRAEPRTAVPAGAVGLASRYCGIYPRSSPGGWQLIGRSDAALFDVHREPPALLTPGTRVRFSPQRAGARPTATTAAALARAAREAAAVPSRLGRRRAQRPGLAGTRPVLEVLSPGPLSLLQDAGRPGRAAIGVSSSGAFDRGAMRRANLAVGTPSGAPVLETLVGPLVLRALAATVLAVSGARAPVRIGRGDEEVGDVALAAEASRERALALDPGDRVEVGPAEDGLRLVLAVRGGIQRIQRRASPEAGAASGASDDARTAPTDEDGAEVLGSLSRDTLSGLGPAPLRAGDVLCAGPEQGLDAVPVAGATSVEGTDPAGSVLTIPVLVGPRAELLGTAAVAALLGTEWTVRQDSDRVGVRLEGPALPVPEGAGSVPSEPMLPGAVQVPPSGLPVVFGPDHPATGGYPVIAVVTRRGLDALAQAEAGTRLRLVDAADGADGDDGGGDGGGDGGTRWSPPVGR
jgi:KipI family sensor histidine kinase inhibitor